MEKIVVGIDGSDASKDALRWAVEDARARGAEVVALHAYEVPVPAADASPAPPVDLPALVAEAHTGAQQFVTKVVDEVVGNAVSVDVAPIAVEDAPAKALLDASRDADLLVGRLPRARAERFVPRLGQPRVRAARRLPGFDLSRLGASYGEQRLTERRRLQRLDASRHRHHDVVPGTQQDTLARRAPEPLHRHDPTEQTRRVHIREPFHVDPGVAVSGAERFLRVTPVVPDVVIEPARREFERGHEHHDRPARVDEVPRRAECADVVLDVFEDVEGDDRGMLRLW